LPFDCICTPCPPPLAHRRYPATRSAGRGWTCSWTGTTATSAGEQVTIHSFFSWEWFCNEVLLDWHYSNLRKGAGEEALLGKGLGVGRLVFFFFFFFFFWFLSPLFCFFALSCPVPCCTALHCTLLKCIVLYCFVPCCTVLYCTVLFAATLMFQEFLAPIRGVPRSGRTSQGHARALLAKAVDTMETVWLDPGSTLAVAHPRGRNSAPQGAPGGDRGQGPFFLGPRGPAWLTSAWRASCRSCR